MVLPHLGLLFGVSSPGTPLLSLSVENRGTDLGTWPSLLSGLGPHKCGRFSKV